MTDAIANDLSSRIAMGEEIAGAETFIENHNQQLEKLGLAKDENGNFIKASEKPQELSTNKNVLDELRGTNSPANTTQAKQTTVDVNAITKTKGYSL